MAKPAKKRAAKKAVAKEASGESKSANASVFAPFTLPRASAGPPKRLNASALRRRKIRDSRWADADEVIWDRRTEKGFTTIPRTLPLIGGLIKLLTNNGDASRVYFDLWARAFDEGMVEIHDEAEFALSSGYSPGTRHVRTWQERMRELQELGFIAVRPKPSRSFGFVLLIHPHRVVARLLEKEPDRIPQWWRDLFASRIQEIGAGKRNSNPLDAFLPTANGPHSTTTAPEGNVDSPAPKAKRKKSKQ